VKVLTLTERQVEYGRKVRDRLAARGLRAELDARNEKLGYKIREAQLAKVPYMLVVGDKEMETGTVAPRSRTGGNAAPVDLETFAKQLEAEVRSHGNAAAVPRLEGNYAENQD
jgi:threonyl-tRNA synthetase